MLEIKLSEHATTVLYPREVGLENEQTIAHHYSRYSNLVPRTFKRRKGRDEHCFQLQAKGGLVSLSANYYIGLDWLVTGESFVQVQPKVNMKVLEAFETKLDAADAVDKSPDPGENEQHPDPKNLKELNYLKMFLDALAHPVVAQKLYGLIAIDWDAPRIPVPQQQDMLTPFLILQFLKLLKDIARKGLKKSYYKVQNQLNGKIKGKIMVSEHIKRNLVKHRPSSSYCQYEEFGVDNTENRFLKEVLQYAQRYLTTNPVVFKGMEATIAQMINFCRPAFSQVSKLDDTRQLRHLRNSPFFREYTQAIRIGELILKRFAYNFSQVGASLVPTPPFWIDMPLLFELYTYSHLLGCFSPDQIEYHHSTYGNELDFLIKKEGFQMVVDAKYKLHYKAGHFHSDIRQVSGYARLKTVYDALGKKGGSHLINCLIIFPSHQSDVKAFKLADELGSLPRIGAYHGMYKLGIPMPWM